MKTGSMSEMMLTLTGPHDGKFGSTTTIKEQVENIEITIYHFRKTLEVQCKCQNDLQMQIKAFEEKTRTDINEMRKEVLERVDYLTDLFGADTAQQKGEFEYLYLQNNILQDEHIKLIEYTVGMRTRAEEIYMSVGM